MKWRLWYTPMVKCRKCKQLMTAEEYQNHVWSCNG